MNKPTNRDYETSVISGMMNSDECFYKALTELEVDHFEDSITRNLFTRLSENNDRQTASMLIKSSTSPKEKSAIQLIDGTWKNVKEFNFSFEGLKDIYNKRQLYYTINKAIERFDEAETEELSNSIIDEIQSIYTEKRSDDIILTKERAPEALSEFMEIMSDPNLAKGIPYSITLNNGVTMGFPSLDKAFYGASGGDLIMVAAKTGEGKTGFAVNLTRLFSFSQNYHGYYMNTEMRIRELEARLLAPIANVKANEILHGTLEGTQDEISRKVSRISEAFDIYMKTDLYLSRIPDLPLHKAKGLAKQIKNQYKQLDYLIVDYVGRMEVADFNGSTWDELYEITKQLKELAMLLDVPIFMLAQRNQAGEVEGAKKMMNECDGVLFFEPTNEGDEPFIEQNITRENQQRVNYKIVKKKVRRDDNQAPIYVQYDKARNFINEVV